MPRCRLKKRKALKFVEKSLHLLQIDRGPKGGGSELFEKFFNGFFLFLPIFKIVLFFQIVSIC